MQSLERIEAVNCLNCLIWYSCVVVGGASICTHTHTLTSTCRLIFYNFILIFIWKAEIPLEHPLLSVGEGLLHRALHHTGSNSLECQDLTWTQVSDLENKAARPVSNPLSSRKHTFCCYQCGQVSEAHQQEKPFFTSDNSRTLITAHSWHQPSVSISPLYYLSKVCINADVYIKFAPMIF